MFAQKEKICLFGDCLEQLKMTWYKSGSIRKERWTKGVVRRKILIKHEKV